MNNIHTIRQELHQGISQVIDPDIERKWITIVNTFNQTRGNNTTDLNEVQKFARFLVYTSRIVNYIALQYMLPSLTSTEFVNGIKLTEVIGPQTTAFYVHYLAGCMQDQEMVDFLEAISVMYGNSQITEASIHELIMEKPKFSQTVLDFVENSFNFNMENVRTMIQFIWENITHQILDIIPDKPAWQGLDEIEVDGIMNTLTGFVNALIVSAWNAQFEESSQDKEI